MACASPRLQTGQESVAPERDGQTPSASRLPYRFLIGEYLVSDARRESPMSTSDMAMVSTGSEKTSGLRRPANDAARQVRRDYERRPYPAVGGAGRFNPVWRIAPFEWIDALCPSLPPMPRRILVAGCGTGNEAFALRKRFPKAEIVAVDFSAPSIKLAREVQRRFFPGMKIKFRGADLAARDFAKTVRGEFDFISCHGVLSYVPKPGRVLRNLASVLSSEGVLYLGVNGARHFSEEWRPVLREFGFDLDVFADNQRLRDVIALCDTLAGFPAGRPLAEQPSDYLAGDLFGAMIANLSLEQWVAMGRRNRLHFCGSYGAHRTLRLVLNSELYARLLPRARTEVHAIVERIAPSSFHSLVFTARPPSAVPWDNEEELFRWRLRLTNLYRIRPPSSSKPRREMCRISLRSQPTNTQADLTVPAAIVALIRSANDGPEVRDILGDSARSISPQSLRKHLYLLHLLGAVNLEPPA